MASLLRLLCCLVLLFQLLAPARAVLAATPEPFPVIAMQHTSWTAADGAPSGVSGIAQTPDGWLWIGGSSGLFRFDGVRFERAPAPLAPLSTNINKLGLLADGSLWITYKFGGASLMKGGAMRHFRVGERAMPGGTSDSLGQDGVGRIWLGMRPGLRLLGADGNWQLPPDDLAVPEGDVISMLLDRRGTFWVRTRGAVYALRQHGARFERKLAVGGTGALAEHPDGSIWTSDMMAAGLHLVEGVPGTDAQAWRTPDHINNFRFDRHGEMWLPGSMGVFRLGRVGSALAQHTGKANGLSGQHGFTTFEDSEDNLWIGTENGIDRFRRYRLQALALPRYIAGARPLAAHPRGGVWIDRSFVTNPQAAPEQIGPPSSDADLTTALHSGADGTLWSGGIGGLWKIRAGGAREAVPLPLDVPDPKRTVIFSLASGPGGALWVSMGRRGLYTVQDGVWRSNGGFDELGALAPTVMTGDAHGRVWFGSTDDRLAILERGAVRRAGRAEGLNMGTVLAILPEKEGAWIGGENGLAWYDGKQFIQILGRGGETFAGTTGLVFALDGTLWINGGAGISSIKPDQLRSALRHGSYRVQFERLDYRDGLPGTASGITPLPSAVRSVDGTLWFSTMGGVVGFDPRNLPRNTRVPPVSITAFKAGGNAFPLQDGVRVGPNPGSLEIAFSALSYRAPERMRVRYRLEGFDTAWQEPERRRSAQYTNLAPGRYRFVVTASNDDGVWNDKGAALSFEIAPSLTQTLAFRLSCAGALVALLWLLHRMRLRRMARRVTATMNERLAERERIARELHDTLLQSVQGLILKIGSVVHRLRPDERPALEAALDQANQVLVEGRDRVAGLRGESRMQPDLADAIDRFGAPLAREGGVRFEVITQGAPVALERHMADEVFAIAREAIRNAFAHAGASLVGVTLDYRGGILALTVQDDGCGIDPAILRQGGRSGHWGIRGMRERAAGIGLLDVDAHPGRGTAWRLTVTPGAAKPASIAESSQAP